MKLSLDLSNVILMSIGNVPKPKTYIIAALCQDDVDANVDESAIYTNPQGSNPFNIPVISNVLRPGLPIMLPNCFLTTPAHGKLNLA